MNGERASFLGGQPFSFILLFVCPWRKKSTRKFQVFCFSFLRFFHWKNDCFYGSKRNHRHSLSIFYDGWWKRKERKEALTQKQERRVLFALSLFSDNSNFRLSLRFSLANYGFFSSSPMTCWCMMLSRKGKSLKISISLSKLVLFVLVNKWSSSFFIPVCCWASFFSLCQHLLLFFSLSQVPGLEAISSLLLQLFSPCIFNNSFRSIYCREYKKTHSNASLSL